MAAIRDEQPSLDVDRHRLHNGLIFLQKSKRIENHAAPDDARRFGLENARRDQMQYVPAISEADGVSGVMSALITGDAVKFLRENIDNLSLAFVAPLDAYNCEIAFH